MELSVYPFQGEKPLDQHLGLMYKAHVGLSSRLSAFSTLRCPRPLLPKHVPQKKEALLHTGPQSKDS